MTTAPAPRSSGTFQAVTASHPVQLTTFIGREREIAAVDNLLQSTRLLTLTGVGGAGKTRLAAEIAARVAPRFEATGWVDLASLADPALVPQVVAAALGYREEGERSAVETMVHGLRERATLVILDNCEHLVEACADVAETLLKGCPIVRILATSREALGVPGEQAWLVPPLSLPGRTSLPEVLDSEAGRLFVERARAALPSFVVDDSIAPAVSQICCRLDGIPLAIELAAARVRVLAPQQIAARLDDAFTLLTTSGRSRVQRHRTLRGTIDWSHALLTPAEAELFRRLSVFAGTFSLDAVEAICEGDDVLDVLSSLVDKSLVVMEAVGGEARYRLLETLRQYAQERLAAANEVAATRHCHALFYTELVVARERDTFGGAGDPDWSARLVAEEGNLRAAGDWAAESGDPTTSLQLCAALHWHWFARGQFRDGWQRLRQALTRAGDADPLSAGKAHVAAAVMALWLGERAQVAHHAQLGVALLRGQRDTWQLAYALVALAIATSDPGAAESLFVEATALVRTQGPRSVLLTFALYWHGLLALGENKLDDAQRMLEEGQAIGRELGHQPAIAHPLSILGHVKLRRGALQAAAADLRESLRIHAANRDLIGCFWSLEGLARWEQLSGRPQRAAQIIVGVRDQRDQIGAELGPQDTMDLDALGATAATDRSMTLAELVEYALESNPRVADAEPARPAVAPEPGTGRVLTIRALGPVQILLDGVPLVWTSAKPRELLLLLSCYPAGRTREQVGLAFWPDASIEQVRNNFHVILHRLRKTLGGTQWVRLSNEQYAVDPQGAVDFDARRFERDVTAGLARFKNTGDATLLESALALYGGDFLANEVVGDWHLELRDRLRQKYVGALATLGERRMKEERWSEAAEAWRRLVAGDELDERAYRGLMTCHARLGERSQVQQLYQRMERLLKAQLEAQPQYETTQLYRRLLSN
ncbi:MAG TPA: BTAD domain-containing putative transcriptional regulator [Gemmatimonadales bacterium]|nr:BTAD domain-containing putative transcriptional regulator [Gemmatimonadales bacterium]